MPTPSQTLAYRVGVPDEQNAAGGQNSTRPLRRFLMTVGTRDRIGAVVVPIAVAISGLVLASCGTQAQGPATTPAATSASPVSTQKVVPNGLNGSTGTAARQLLQSGGIFNIRTDYSDDTLNSYDDQKWVVLQVYPSSGATMNANDPALLVLGPNPANPPEKLDPDTIAANRGQRSAPSTPAPPSATEKDTSFSTGTYTVGDEIAAGTYRTAGGSTCYWARLSSTSGDFEAIIANNLVNGPATMTVKASDAAVEFAGTCTWVKK